jgi:hypothetical protein
MYEVHSLPLIKNVLAGAALVSMALLEEML